MATPKQIAANRRNAKKSFGHDRAYQRASAELQKLKKARQLAEIGFASQKRAEAEESRKAERHA
ncbi:MAG: hypothetical protein ACRD45_18090, partial [Bryobacteraceae bacterium]